MTINDQIRDEKSPLGKAFEKQKKKKKQLKIRDKNKLRLLTL